MPKTVLCLHKAWLCSLGGVSEKRRHEHIVSGCGQFLRIESVQRIIEDLLIESVSMDGPEMFHVSVVFLVEPVFADNKWQDESVCVLTEQTVSSEKAAILTEHGEHGALACELVDCEPSSCSEEQRVQEVFFAIALEFHLSSANGLLIGVEFAEGFELAIDVKLVQEASQNRFGSFVLLTVIVLTVNVVSRQAFEVLASKLLVVVGQNH